MPADRTIFLPSFRERVGVKIGVSNFSAETHMQQDFDAPSLKKKIHGKSESFTG